MKRKSIKSSIKASLSIDFVFSALIFPTVVFYAFFQVIGTSSAHLTFAFNDEMGRTAYTISELFMNNVSTEDNIIDEEKIYDLNHVSAENLRKMFGLNKYEWFRVILSYKKDNTDLNYIFGYEMQGDISYSAKIERIVKINESYGVVTVYAWRKKLEGAF